MMTLPAKTLKRIPERALRLIYYDYELLIEYQRITSKRIHQKSIESLAIEICKFQAGLIIIYNYIYNLRNFQELEFSLKRTVVKFGISCRGRQVSNLIPARIRTLETLSK